MRPSTAIINAFAVHGKCIEAFKNIPCWYQQLAL